MYGDKTMICQAIDAGANTDMFGIITYELLGSFKAPIPHDIVMNLKSWEQIK